MKQLCIKIFHIFLNFNELKCHSCDQIIQYRGNHFQKISLYLCNQCHFKIAYIFKREFLRYSKNRKYPKFFDKQINKNCIRCVSFFEYGEVLKKLILNYKYFLKLESEKSLGELFNIGLNHFKLDLKDFDFIIPVPQGRKKYWKRGFHPLYPFCKKMNKKLGIKILWDCLIKSGEEVPQSLLNKSSRLYKIKGTISLNKKYEEMIRDKKIIIVDDIITTGATLFECVKGFGNVLKPSNIFVVSFSRTSTYF